MDAKLTGEPGSGETILTAAERKLLEAVRQERTSKITVHKRQGKILNIETEEDIPPSDLDDIKGVLLSCEIWRITSR